MDDTKPGWVNERLWTKWRLSERKAENQLVQWTFLAKKGKNIDLSNLFHNFFLQNVVSIFFRISFRKFFQNCVPNSIKAEKDLRKCLLIIWGLKVFLPKTTESVM